MDRKLMILKAVLLLRRTNKHQNKEEQIAMAEKYYSDEQIKEWIELLQQPSEPESDEYEYDCPPEYELSGGGRSYSPSNPWDAPGMSVRDFI